MPDPPSQLLLLVIDLCVKLGAEKRHLLKVRFVCVCYNMRSNLQLRTDANFDTVKYLKI